MSDYPLKVRVYESNYTPPEPDGKLSEYTVRARRAGADDRVEFYIIDPMNGGELGAYASRADSPSGADHYYWVDEVLSDDTGEE